MLPDNLKTAYENFYHTARDNGIINKKTTRMIQLAAAFALGCYP